MQTAEKLTLPPEMVHIIREKVGTGAYSAINEVIREALRDWMERKQRLFRRLPEALPTPRQDEHKKSGRYARNYGDTHEP